MKVKVVVQIALVAFAVVGVPPSSRAGTITPAGLNPGDTYRLVFVTSATTPTYDPFIESYDSFVTAAAQTSPSLLASLGASWKVIGSTNWYNPQNFADHVTVNAIDHIGTFSSPIYNLAGLLVANNSSDLWDGGIENPININEAGNVNQTSGVWTGTNANGSVAGGPLGGGQCFFDCFGPYLAQGGLSNEATYWLQWDHVDRATEKHVYGISSTLTVPGGESPEPGTVSLMLLGSVCLFWRVRHAKM